VPGASGALHLVDRLIEGDLLEVAVVDRLGGVAGGLAPVAGALAAGDDEQGDDDAERRDRSRDPSDV
jgi:hypothetical protein